MSKFSTGLIFIFFVITGQLHTSSHELDPTVLAKLAHQHIKEGNLEQALELYKKFLHLNPNNARALYNIGHILKVMGRMQEASAIYEHAIALKPDYHVAHIGLAKTYLALGDFERGLQEFEWRYADPDTFKQHPRNPAEFTGKRVYLRAEWGLGDTMQFIRYAHLLKRAGATIIVEAHHPLVQLFSNFPYIDKLVSSKSTIMPPWCDMQIPLLSLPLVCGATPETIYTEIPYLYADQELIKLWKNNLEATYPSNHLKVGLCWQAKPGIFLEQQPRTRRSIPLAQFAPLATIEGVSFFSLQQQHGVEQLDNLPDGFVVHAFGDDFDNSHGRFMDTAAVIKNLDLIISVDTSIVHLAGGLGAQVWVLLPHSAEWRWMLEREDTPWYPGMRLFRQPQPGNWQSIIERIRNELQNLVENLKRPQ